jgi:Flp pilus assembly protein TadD
MSLLMEALKKAEQLKASNLEASQNTPVATKNTETLSEKTVDSVMINEPVDLFDEPVDIEDPNSVFNDELEWNFDIEDDELELPQDEIKQVADEPLELTLSEPEPVTETPKTSLLEQAEIADKSPQADEKKQEVIVQSLLDIDDEKQVNESITEKNEPITEKDELIWDDEIIAVETPNIEKNQLPVETEKQDSELKQNFINDELEWDAGIFAPDPPKTEEEQFNADIEYKIDDDIQTKLKAEITQPNSISPKRVFPTAPRPRNSYKRVALLLILLVAILLSFAGYYAYQLNMFSQLPQMTAFMPSETLPQTEPLPASTQPPITSAVIAENNEEIEPKRQTFMEKAKTLISDVMDKPNVTAPETNEEQAIEYKPAPTETVISVQRTTKMSRPQQPLLTKSIIGSLDNEQPRPLPQQQQDNKDIKIKKVSSNNQRVNNELNRAYQAFQTGQNQQAKRLYQQILNKNSKNRDALLGLAAIAQRDNQTQEAIYYYQQILKYYPNDSMAQMGLNTMQQTLPQNSESQIKILLDKSPQSAYLHFSLGNVYAQQKRWRQAQQAYFDAHRFDETKADYAYNLAVSLEHIHQSKAALPFYEKALQLSQNQATQFNSEQVKRRIAQLKN